MLFDAKYPEVGDFVTTPVWAAAEVMNYGNFNTYVNSHRLADAQRWLADPAQQGTPVLTLALDAGFGSIGPFNRAFKAETGLTPTEFRAQALMQKLAENRNS